MFWRVCKDRNGMQRLWNMVVARRNHRLYFFANYDELLKAAPQNYTSCYFLNWNRKIKPEKLLWLRSSSFNKSKGIAISLSCICDYQRDNIKLVFLKLKHFLSNVLTRLIAELYIGFTSWFCTGSRTQLSVSAFLNNVATPTVRIF